jgi:surfactin synthase thioesterase subunit
LAAQAGSAAQPGSVAQAGAQSQLVRPRRPRPAAEAVSAATRPTMTNTKSIEKIVEKRFIEKLLEKNKTESQSLED